MSSRRAKPGSRSRTVKPSGDSFGTTVGTVREVVHGPGGELLVLARPGVPDALVPFVRAIVPTVDLDGGRVVLTPPEGLLD